MPIVYDGVNGKQGDLFQGLKLWIGHRVPQRSRYVDLVKGNGGEVVPLEKNADMLIADNIKKGGVSPPDGSYSWKWIDISVKNGFLEDQSDYLIRTEAREVGSCQPAKTRRNPFTQTDDAILAKWVLSNMRRAEPDSNVEMYKKLERRHSQHTWQSWRERWIKRLSNRPSREIADQGLEQEATESRATPEQAANASPVARVTRSARQAQPSEESKPDPNPSTTRRQAEKTSALAPAPNPASGDRAIGRGRKAFTQEEDKMLLDYVRKQRSLQKHLSGNKIYQDFAEDHPAHSWRSWRDRWLKHLSLREAVDDDGPDDEPNPAQDVPGDEGEQQPRRGVNKPALEPLGSATATSPTAADGNIEVAATAGARSPSLRPAVSEQPNPKSDEERLKRREQERRVARAAKLWQETWGGQADGRDRANLEAAFVPLQSIMRGYLVRLREAERMAKALEGSNNPAKANDVHRVERHEIEQEALQGSDTGSAMVTQHDPNAKEQFYNDLQAYVEVSGATVDVRPVINGQAIYIWDLFKLATQQDCQPQERNWGQVVVGLGFDNANIPVLAREVRHCYQQNLADFEEAIKAFDNDDGLEEDIEDESEEACDGALEDLLPTQDAPAAPKLPLVNPSSPAYQSSPPLVASKRPRRHSELLTSDLNYPPDGSRKRRRLSKDIVIPPTPEQELELSRSQLRRGIRQDKSSPLKSRGAAKDEIIELSSGEESDDFFDVEMEDGEGLYDLPRRVEPAPRKYAEPETQDWHFDTENKQILRRSIEEDDPSPSQQLQLESDAYKSPERHISRTHVAVEPRATRPSTATVASRGAGKTGSRALKSDGVLTQVGSSGARAFQAPVNGKVMKRTLPPQYQRKPVSTASMIVPDFRSSRIADSQQPPISKLQDSVRPTGVGSVHPADNNTSRAKPSTRYTPAGSLQSSSRQPAVFPSSTSPESANGNGIKNQEPAVTYDQAYVDAQIEHFQGLGYQAKHIAAAMQAATFQRGPMGVAVQSLAEGRGIPPDEAGIWTLLDDKYLRMIMEYDRLMEKGKQPADAAAENQMKVKVWKARSKLDVKHSTEGVKLRVEFMRMLDAENGQRA